MTEPTTKPRNPIRVAIIVLSVALILMAALVAYLFWGRTAPTVVPAPIPSASPTSAAPSAISSTPATAATPTDTSEAPSPPPAAPTTTEAPTIAPSAPAPATPTAPSASPAQTMMWEGKATFEHFTIEVLQDDANQDAPLIKDKAGLLVEVCVAKALDGSDTAHISSDPWTLEDSTGNVQSPQAGGYTPAFPADGEYAVGKCARGYLTFDFLPADNNYAILVYENGLGDRAVWQFH